MAILLDLDGTFCDNAARSYLVDCPNPNWEEFLKPELVALDKPIEGCQKAFDKLIQLDQFIIFLTGRKESLREVSANWIKQYLGVIVDDEHNYTYSLYPKLFMRKNDDFRTPSDFKESVIKELNKYHSLTLAFDDDPFLDKVYFKYNIPSFRAPECWKIFCPMPNLPEEKAMRK